jgi:hypothetical protein
MYDFQRHHPVIHYCPPLVQTFRERYGSEPRRLLRREARNLLDDPWLKLRAEVITDLFRAIRSDLDKANLRHVRLAARVEASYLLHDGCDFVTWVREGLVREFLVQLVLRRSVSAPWWQAGGRFDLAAYLAAWEEELGSLPREVAGALFSQDVSATLCLDLPESYHCGAEDLIRIAGWARVHGFRGMSMHESNVIVAQPGKPAALRACAGLA